VGRNDGGRGDAATTLVREAESNLRAGAGPAALAASCQNDGGRGDAATTLVREAESNMAAGTGPVALCVRLTVQ
jgi:hypothetical protein